MRGQPRTFADLDDDGKACAIWCVLVGEGELPRDDNTIRRCAERLRKLGWANYKKLQRRSELYQQIERTLNGAGRGNEWLKKPRQRHVRAYRQFGDMSEEDWRDCLVKVLWDKGEARVSRDVAVRDTFDEARERFGIERQRLVKSVELPIRSAINSCIRRGFIAREERTT